MTTAGLPQPPASNQFGLRELVDARTAALALAALYALGFLVANLHYARFEPLRLEFLQARYIGAGLLFVFLAFPPLMAGAFAGRPISALFDPTDDEKGTPTALWAIRAVVGAGGATLVAFFFGLFARSLMLTEIVNASLTTSRIEPESFVFRGVPTYGFIAAAVGVFVTFFIRTEYARALKRAAQAAKDTPADAPPALRHFGMSTPAISVIIAVLPTFVFSESVYPYLSPALGGGAGYEAEVHVTSNAQLPNKIVNALDRRVVFIDRDEHVTNIMVCYAGDTIARGVSLQSEHVSAVAIFNRVPLPTRRNTMCRTSRQTPSVQPASGVRLTIDSAIAPKK